MRAGRADVISPERWDSTLGDGWSWSDRHLLQVNTEDQKLWVEGGMLWYDIKKTNKGAMLVFSDKTENEQTDYPVAKMVMLTHFPEAVAELTETFMNE